MTPWLKSSSDTHNFYDSELFFSQSAVRWKIWQRSAQSWYLGCCTNCDFRKGENISVKTPPISMLDICEVCAPTQAAWETRFGFAQWAFARVCERIWSIKQTRSGESWNLRITINSGEAANTQQTVWMGENRTYEWRKKSPLSGFFEKDFYRQKGACVTSGGISFDLSGYFVRFFFPSGVNPTLKNT